MPISYQRRRNDERTRDCNKNKPETSPSVIHCGLGMSRVICDVMVSERCTLLSNNVRDVYGICQIHKGSAAKERLYVLRRMCCVLIAGQPGWSRPLSPPPHRCSRHKSSRRYHPKEAARSERSFATDFAPATLARSFYPGRGGRVLAVRQSKLAGAEGEFVPVAQQSFAGAQPGLPSGRGSTSIGA